MTFSLFTKKNIKVLLSLLKFIYENVLKMHGPKSKFIMKVVQVKKNKKSFFKRREKIFEIKEDGRRRRDYPKAQGKS